MEHDPYASHLQVLNAVLNTHKPKRILEYGGGVHSTHMFLTRPYVESVVTIETSEAWRERLLTMYPDEKLTIFPAKKMSAANFDLIFIDNGQDSQVPLGADRRATIREVLSRPHPIVVIHDADVPEYATAIEEFSVDYAVYRTAPDTAVVYP
jgi:predicted O-methyltransferase YrrM